MHDLVFLAVWILTAGFAYQQWRGRVHSDNQLMQLSNEIASRGASAAVQISEQLSKEKAAHVENVAALKSTLDIVMERGSLSDDHVSLLNDVRSTLDSLYKPIANAQHASAHLPAIVEQVRPFVEAAREFELSGPQKRAKVVLAYLHKHPGTPFDAVSAAIELALDKSGA